MNNMNNVVLLFISQPMSGRPDTEIITEREELFEKAEKALYPATVEEIESFWPDGDDNDNTGLSADGETFTVALSYEMVCNEPLYLLGQSISAMANADYVIFADGWERSRGCQIERACAEKYGIPILEVD